MAKSLGKTLYRWRTKTYAYDVDCRTAKRREERAWRKEVKRSTQ